MKKQLSTEEQKARIKEIMGNGKRVYPKNVVKESFHSWTIDNDFIALELSLKPHHPNHIEKVALEMGIRVSSLLSRIAIYRKIKNHGVANVASTVPFQCIRVYLNYNFYKIEKIVS